MTVFADRNQFIQSPTESCQIKFLLPGSDDPVHIIIAQTLRVVRDTGEMVELNIFRLLEVFVVVPTQSRPLLSEVIKRVL